MPCTARERGRHNAPVVPSRRAKALARFDDRVREPVNALAAIHPRLADLAVSFPGLLVALALPAPRLDPKPVIAATVAGEPLCAIAQAAHVPMWMRKLPIGAFTGPLPYVRCATARRSSKDFHRRISTAIPRSPVIASTWLPAVLEAFDTGTEAAAIWLAHHLKDRRTTVSTKDVRLLMLWAWYATTTHGACPDVPRARWHQHLPLMRALDLADDWFLTVRMHGHLAAAPVKDIWCEAKTIDGYDFLPITTSQDITAEAEAMKHCLATHGCAFLLCTNRARFWSIRKDDARVATCEVQGGTPDMFPRIKQLKGYRNASVAPEVRAAAWRWLRSHDLHDIEPARAYWSDQHMDRQAWQATWRGYWIEKGRIPPWLPLVPDDDVLIMDEFA